jgi:hypothetical protein
MSAAEVGRCTWVMPVMFGQPLGCTLPHGHLGQHHDSTTGAHWGATTKAVRAAVPAARLRALVAFLSPDEITPTAQRLLLRLCDEHPPATTDST